MLKKYNPIKDWKVQAGFTLVELLIAVGIIAVLTAVAVPMYGNNIPRYQLKGAARMIVSDFQRAKMEAVKRNCDIEIIFTPVAYSANGGGGGSYKINVMPAGPPLSTKVMPKHVTLFTTNLGSNNSGYNSQGLALESGSVYLVNNKGTSYKLSISNAGNVSMSLKTVDLGVLPLPAW